MTSSPVASFDDGAGANGSSDNLYVATIPVHDVRGRAIGRVDAAVRMDSIYPRSSLDVRFGRGGRTAVFDATTGLVMLGRRGDDALAVADRLSRRRRLYEFDAAAFVSKGRHVLHRFDGGRAANAVRRRIARRRRRVQRAVRADSRHELADCRADHGDGCRAFPARALARDARSLGAHRRRERSRPRKLLAATAVPGRE